MKKFIFIHGPNGIGKSTICKLLNQSISNSAWLESEWTRYINPFVFNTEVENLTEKNMTFMLRSYLECSLVDTVIFDWGLHGPRKEIYERVLKNLSDLEYEYVPITLLCDIDENIKRMKSDDRSEERIHRTLETRNMYDNLPYFSIDITNLKAHEVVSRIIEHIA